MFKHATDEVPDSDISNDDEPDVFTLYENKLDEIRELKNKLDYIESQLQSRRVKGVIIASVQGLYSVLL